MAHGLPDWSELRPKETVYGLIDLGELAVRLGSIVTFDRRGDVIWMDDFENDLNKWRTVTSGAGASISVNGGVAHRGDFCTKLVAGSTLGRQAKLVGELSYPTLSRLGVEFSFSIDSSLERLSLEILLYTGTVLKRWLVDYWPAEKLIYLYDENGISQTVASDVDLYPLATMFHTWKLVFDANTNDYIRMIADSATYDISAFSAQLQTSSVEPLLSCFIQITGEEATNSVGYIDDVIVTQNEP